jgi:tripartite-type tricarboxylate transporter receptor subunit TctC
VRLVAGYAAGGGTDITARLMGQWLSERFSQAVIIENRLGAGTNIGTEASCVRPPMAMRFSLSHCERDQRDAVRKARFQFHS